jgi:hypothetical protein
MRGFLISELGQAKCYPSPERKLPRTRRSGLAFGHRGKGQGQLGHVRDGFRGSHRIVRFGSSCGGRRSWDVRFACKGDEPALTTRMDFPARRGQGGGPDEERGLTLPTPSHRECIVAHRLWEETTASPLRA